MNSYPILGNKDTRSGFGEGFGILFYPSFTAKSKI